MILRNFSFWRWCAPIVAFAAAAAMTAPASLLKPVISNPASSFQFEKIEGRIWSGVIKGARLNAVNLGDISFRPRLSRVLRGEMYVDLHFTGPDIAGAGAVSASLGRTARVENFNATIDLTAAARRYLILGAPVEGVARVELNTVRLNQNGCVVADGSVWTDVLRGPAQAFNGQAFDLNGPIDCDGTALRVRLAGDGQEGAATIMLAVRPDLTYVLEADVAPNRVEVDQALRFIGFENGPDGLRYGATGAFKGV